MCSSSCYSCYNTSSSWIYDMFISYLKSVRCSANCSILYLWNNSLQMRVAKWRWKALQTSFFFVRMCYLFQEYVSRILQSLICYISLTRILRMRLTHQLFIWMCRIALAPTMCIVLGISNPNLLVECILKVLIHLSECVISSKNMYLAFYNP